MSSAFRNSASIIALLLLLVVSLYAISDATSNSASFGRYYNWLIFFNAVGLIALLGLIIYNVYKLIVQYRLKAIGSHLTARMIGVFVLLTIIPVSIVYYFSLSFLHRSIDSWFDVGIEVALEDSLQLGRSALDLRKREAINRTRETANELGFIDLDSLVVYLDETRSELQANEITLYDHNQTILASSSVDSTKLPVALALADIASLDPETHSLNLIDDPEYGLALAIAMQVPSADVSEQPKILHALYPHANRLSDLTIGVQEAHDQYKDLAVLRDPLKTSFTLALSTILLLSLLPAIWVSFIAARKLVAPINSLVEGTKAVAAGNYEGQLVSSGNDELGFLLRSFNTMTRKISRSYAIAEQSQKMEAMQRNYLESVMDHITSGVLTINESGFIKSGNPAACDIFDVPEQFFNEVKVETVVEQFPVLKRFFTTVNAHLGIDDSWQEEITVFSHSGRKILRVSGTALFSDGEGHEEQVIVVDDLTELIQAQRESAWSEMARRLAHEIKNPLTPIQLSAERLQRKLGGSVDTEQQGLLDRYTSTIVQQVDAMKSMVNAFTDYARSPSKNPQALDLNDMVKAVCTLYQSDNGKLELNLDLHDSLPMIVADDVRLRQLLHNLLKNAQEAVGKKGFIKVSTRFVEEANRYWVELSIEDSGCGIAEEVEQNLFDPYVTTKADGSGLGLAIVQKIVDEHAGTVVVQSSALGGAAFTVRLPVISHLTEFDQKLETMSS